MTSNREIVINTVQKHPGLRFHELKKETKLANGTLQHHLNQLTKDDSLAVIQTDKIPRYFSENVDNGSAIILNRLRQNTTSRIIKSLLKKKCMSFSQIVKESKKSPGTVSVYKNMLLQDKIIKGNTDECDYCPDMSNKIKYQLINEDLVRTIVIEYGKSSLRQSADNLADVFLAIK